MLFRFSYAVEVALIYDTALCSMHDKSHKGLLVGLFVARVPLNGKSHPPSRMKGLFEIGVLHQADYKKVADFRDYPGKLLLLLLRDNYRLHRNSWRNRRRADRRPWTKKLIGTTSNDRPTRRSFLACMIRRDL